MQSLRSGAVSRRRAAIDFTLGHYRLCAGLWPTLATVALLPLLVSLGVWQMERAEQKQHLQAEFDRLQQEPAKRLRSVLEPAASLHFHRIAVRGRYEVQHQFLLDNRVHRGQAGYHVLTPLRIENGAVRVLINRGWVAVGPDRNRLPPVDPPSGWVEITGVATVPQVQGFRLGSTKPAAGGWQSVWQYLDLDEYRRSVNFPVQPFVVLPDPDSAPDGLVRHWTRLDSGVRTHQGYAFQWFSLAVALVAIYILVNTRRREDDGSSPDTR